MKKANRIAVVGATGLVGKAFLSILEEKIFIKAEVDLLASKKSEGKKVTFRDSEYVIADLAEYDFSNTDLALFSAGASVSAKFAPIAVSQGCVGSQSGSTFPFPVVCVKKKADRAPDTFCGGLRGPFSATPVT